MYIDDYQQWTEETAIYEDEVYPVLALAEEAGEVAGKYAKYLRDKTSYEDLRRDMKKELGDVAYQLARVAYEMDWPMSEILAANMNKLTDRKLRGKLGGSGDDR